MIKEAHLNVHILFVNKSPTILIVVVVIVVVIIVVVVVHVGNNVDNRVGCDHQKADITIFTFVSFG